MTRNHSLIGSIAVCLMLLPAFTCARAQDNNKRPGLTDGELAYNSIQIQNLMSEHEYYHAAGMNLEEVDALWVSPTGPNAKTACFFSPGWVMQGVATIRKNYGEQHQLDKEKAFEELKQAYPELANLDPKTANIGGEFAMHTSTTPVIQVAGDGKTAKGIWYSPGIGLMPHVSGSSVTVGSIFFWEKYAGDFIKENGKWKIWHLGMYYDFTPAFPDSMTARMGKGTPPAQAAGPGGPPPNANDNKEKGEKLTPEEIAKGGMLPDPYQYPSWSPDRKSLIVPKFPEPYYTFSETFSYAPYDANNQMKYIKY